MVLQKKILEEDDQLPKNKVEVPTKIFVGISSFDSFACEVDSCLKFLGRSSAKFSLMSGE